MIKDLKYKLLRSVFACMALVLFTQCDFIFKPENNKEQSFNAERVAVKKNEAKLLVDATQHNLDVRELIEVIKERDIDTHTEKIVNSIEKYQLNVFNQYEQVAKEQVISIPNFSLVNKKQYLLDNRVPVEEVLTKITSKLQKQIDSIQRLMDKSNNAEFIEMAKKVNEQLVMSLDKTDLLKEEISKQI